MATEACSICPLRWVAEIDDFEGSVSELRPNSTKNAGRRFGTGAFRMALRAVSTALLKTWPNGQPKTFVVPVGAQGFILRHAGPSCDPAQVCVCARACALTGVRRA